MINISATVMNEGRQHQTILRTDDKEQYLMIPVKAEELGSSVNASSPRGEGAEWQSSRRVKRKSNHFAWI